MSFFATYSKTIAIDDENSVVVRQLAYGEEQDIRQRCMKMRAGVEMQERRRSQNGKQMPEDERVQAEMTFDTIQMTRLTLYAQITDWDGPGFRNRQGEKVPATPENIDQLPSTVVDKIIDGINEVFQPLSEEEKN